MKSLQKLIQQARDEQKMLWCRYQNLWFLPDQLEDLNQRGKFRWGAINFELRDSMERVEQLNKELKEKEKELIFFEQSLNSRGW